MMIGARQDTNPIVVWIVEDDTEYSETLSFLLDHTSDMRCSTVFKTSEEILATSPLDHSEADRSGDRSYPDVILLDINLPGRSGIESLPDIKSRFPLASIVMLTIRDEAETIYQALQRGASGYLLKNASVDEIIAAVRQAKHGGTLMPAPVARKVLAFFQEEPQADYGLTERELETLGEMTLGFSQKEIGARLFISPNTVNTHIQHIYKKLHVRSGIEAVAKALREGLV